MLLPAVTSNPAAPPPGAATVFNRPLLGLEGLLRLAGPDGRVVTYCRGELGENVATYAAGALTSIQRYYGRGAAWAARTNGGQPAVPGAAAIVDRYARTRVSSGLGPQDSCYFFLQPLGAGDVVVSRRDGFFVAITSAFRTATLAGSVGWCGLYGAPIVPADVATSAPDVFGVGWRADAPDLALRTFRRAGSAAHTIGTLSLARDDDVLRTVCFYARAGGPFLGLAILDHGTGDFINQIATDNLPGMDVPLVIEAVQGNWLTGQVVVQDVVSAYARWGAPR